MSADPGLSGNSPPLFYTPERAAVARELAAEFGLRLGGETGTPPASAEPLILWYDATGLSIRQPGRRAMGPVYCDFVTGTARHRRHYGGGKSQAVARAVGLGKGVRPTVADLTAGLGADAFVLAGLGCRVTLVERQAAIAALLADGLARARLAGQSDRELAEVVARMRLVRAQAREWLAAAEESPDVIYLDPMFPERRKSAQVNKTMQIFQQLAGNDDDAAQLLPLALERAGRRVVVKRPAKAPWLGEREPSHSLTGKSVRFDIYALRRMAA